ncbi:MAG: DUF1931 domain-containing protein [Nanoarchaeota archaeon]
MADSVVVKAKVKDLIGDFNLSSDFTEELDKQVRELIAKASRRAELNNRRTIMAKDL